MRSCTGVAKVFWLPRRIGERSEISVPRTPRLPVVASAFFGCSCLLLAAPGGSWLPLAAPDLPPNWCSRPGETRDFPKPAASCTQNHMFRNSVWLLALGCSGLPGAALGCSRLLGAARAALGRGAQIYYRTSASKCVQLLASGKYSPESASQLVLPCRRDARFFKTGLLVHAKRYVFKLGVTACSARRARRCSWLPCNWCSRARETSDFPNLAFPCTRNDMFSNSAWLCSGLLGVLWAACSGLLGQLWAAMSKFIVVPLRQNACKFWRLENTHPDLPPNWCSGAGEMPNFPKPTFSCTQNHMFRHSVWLFALG